MKKPDYKGAEKDILALLETEPEPTTPSSNNKIIDVTEIPLFSHNSHMLPSKIM